MQTKLYCLRCNYYILFIFIFANLYQNWSKLQHKCRRSFVFSHILLFLISCNICSRLLVLLVLLLVVLLLVFLLINSLANEVAKVCIKSETQLRVIALGSFQQKSYYPLELNGLRILVLFSRFRKNRTCTNHGKLCLNFSSPRDRQGDS